MSLRGHQSYLWYCLGDMGCVLEMKLLCARHVLCHVSYITSKIFFSISLYLRDSIKPAYDWVTALLCTLRALPWCLCGIL